MSFGPADQAVSRQQRLQRLLADEGLDAYLIGHPRNVTYLTGFSGESSALLVGRQRVVLVSDGRFVEQLAEECPGLATYIRPPSQPLIHAVAEALAKLAFRAVGFESSSLTVGEFETLREALPTTSWKGSPDRVERLRAIKDAGEVAQIREAIGFAEQAFARFRARLRPEDTEKDLVDALEMYVRQAGGRCTSFPSIVAVGERAALPHAPPTRRRVSEGNLLLVDWGACGAFYHSDLTRVLLPHKNAAFSRSEGLDAEKLRHLYGVVLQAQQAAIAAIRPGVLASVIDAQARSVISAAGFGDYFNHGLGHGVGLEIHEAPMLKAGSQAVLQENMVITIEPGIYLPGWAGVRIEDDVLVTDQGAEVLTTVPRDFESQVVRF